MLLEFGNFSPNVKIGFVSASRNCFPLELSQKRAKSLIDSLKKNNIDVVLPKGDCSVIKTKQDAILAAEELKRLGCDGAILYLGNFSPEIEDAIFVKEFNNPIILIAAAEESKDSIACNRGDALCGLISAMLAIKNRNLDKLVYLPNNPLVDVKNATNEILRFSKILKGYKGIKNATIGLFGPRPRDFESCNYNIAALSSIGVEVEELALFDLEDEVERLRTNILSENISVDSKSFTKLGDLASDDDFIQRLSLYEQAIINFRNKLSLSGVATQCWSRQEIHLKHVPCVVNSRLTEKGFPVACENDAYSLVSELICQYISNESVTMLDINHTIPHDMLKDYPNIKQEDVFGLFHCGNVPASRMRNPKLRYQLIMSRLMEPGTTPDITRGTIEGQILPSEITILQIHGSGDSLRAYICEGSFIDINPNTFGSTGVAHVNGFMRFYRNCILGRFHHHAAVAFSHCGREIYALLKMLGIKEIYVPSESPYPNENIFV